jgi:hypothetical protein
MKIVCKIYTLGKLTYQLPPLGPANLLVFHLSGLGLWILFMLKRPLEPHCKHHILTNEHRHHICSQRYATTILASSFTLYFYSFCTFMSLTKIVHYCIFVFLELCVCIYLLYFCLHFILKIIWINIGYPHQRNISGSPRLQGMIMRLSIRRVK